MEMIRKYLLTVLLIMALPGPGTVWGKAYLPTSVLEGRYTLVRDDRPVIEPPAAVTVAAAAPENSYSLTTDDCLFLALQNNLSLKVSKLSVESLQAAVTAAEAGFDPYLSLTPSYSSDLSQSLATYGTAAWPTYRTVTRWASGNASLTKPLRSGGSIVVDYTVSRTDQNSIAYAINPYYTSALNLTFSHPLVEGRGYEINESGITNAINNVDIATLQFDSLVTDLVANTENLYWNIFATGRQLEVKTREQEILTRMKAEIEIGIEVGTKTRLDMMQVETELGFKDEDIMLLTDQLRGAQDQLRELLGLTEEGDWNKDIHLTDEPRVIDETYDLNELLRNAFECRQDVAVQKLELANADIGVMVAENALLPDISLTLSGGLDGMNRNVSEAHEDMFEGDYYQVSASLTAMFPFADNGEEAAAHVSRLSRDIVEQNIRALNLRVNREIRNDFRTLVTASRRIEVTEQGVALAEEKLSQEQEKYNIGLATTIDLLRFNRDVTEARTRHINAVTDMMKNIIRLHRNCGTLLKYRDIYFRTVE